MGAQETEKKQYRIETLLLCVFPVIGVITFFVIEKGIRGFFVSKGFFIQAFLAFFLSCLFVLFIRQEKFLRKHGRITNAYFLGSYALSFFWLGLSAAEHTGFFWFLLFLYLALEDEMKAASAAELFLLTEYALLEITSSAGMKQFVCYFILANVSLFLFSKLKNLKEIPFLFVILLATDGALLLYTTGFKVFEKPDADQISSQIISIFALTAVGALYVRFLKKKKKSSRITAQKNGQLLNMQSADAVKEAEMDAFEKEKIKIEEQKSEVERTQTVLKQENAVLEQEETVSETEQTMLQRVLELTFPLSLRLREFSPALYEHSQKISTLSGQAAGSVGADELLARAGGLYHEIGKITSEQNYISAGEKLGRDSGFGDRLLAILRQHNPTNEVPDSPEALVVMLSDSIITSGDFLRKNGQRELVSDEMLVKNIFLKRREQGSLSRAGLSAEQLKKLETFYIEHIAEIESM